MKDWRRGVAWIMIYFVMMVESTVEMLEPKNRWREALESKGLTVYLDESQFLESGRESGTVVTSGENFCGVCGKGAEVNSEVCKIKK